MFSAVCGFRLDRHLDRVVQVFRGELADGGRHSGREQRHLLVLGGLSQDPFDVLGEAHVEHFVGLVEHQIVEVGEVESALLEVVDDAARRPDDDLRAALESSELRAVGGAAVDGQHVDRQVSTVTTERLGDLQRQLAGGRQHQRLGGLVGGVDLGQDRGGERGGLAGAGLRETDDVRTGHHRRNRGGLDRGRGLVPDVGNRPQHRRVKLQVSEFQVGACSVRLGRRHRVVSLVVSSVPTRRAACRIGGGGDGTVRNCHEPVARTMCIAACPCERVPIGLLLPP